MSKGMLGAAGGKVTVTGLSAAALIPGATVTVKSGSKIVQQAESNIDVLASSFFNSNAGFETYVWNGSEYQKYNNTGGSFVGTPKIVIIIANVNCLGSVCGIPVPAGITVHKIYTEGFTNNTIQVSRVGANSAGSCIVLGVK